MPRTILQPGRKLKQKTGNLYEDQLEDLDILSRLLSRSVDDIIRTTLDEQLLKTPKIKKLLKNQRKP